MDKELAVRLKLQGLTYQAIATMMGVSRQRVHQAISPPHAVKMLVITRANRRCEDCGVDLGGHGDFHHEGGLDSDYNDVSNLLYLCIPCHLYRHSKLFVWKSVHE